MFCTWNHLFQMFEMPHTSLWRGVEIYEARQGSWGVGWDGYSGQFFLQCVLPRYEGHFSEPYRQGHNVEMNGIQI